MIPCSIYQALTREPQKKRCAAVSLLLELSEAFSSMLTYSQVLRGGMWNTPYWNAPQCTLVSCFTMSYACVSAQPQWILNIPPYENHLTIQKVLCMSSNGLCLTTVVELISWGCVGGCCFNSANTTAGVSSSLHKTRVRLARMGLIAGGHCSRRYQPAFKLFPPEWLQQAWCWQLDCVHALRDGLLWFAGGIREFRSVASNVWATQQAVNFNAVNHKGSAFPSFI